MIKVERRYSTSWWPVSALRKVTLVFWMLFNQRECDVQKIEHTSVYFPLVKRRRQKRNIDLRYPHNRFSIVWFELEFLNDFQF